METLLRGSRRVHSKTSSPGRRLRSRAQQQQHHCICLPRLGVKNNAMNQTEKEKKETPEGLLRVDTAQPTAGASEED